MKRTLLLKSVLSTLFMFMSMCVWAESKTVTFTGGTNVSSTMELTIDGITISLTGGNLSTPEYRIFKKQTITISSSVGNITKTVFNCTANGTTQYGPGCFAEADGYSFEGKVGTWEGDAEQFSLIASNNQVRCNSIEVTYTVNSSILTTTVSFGDDAQSKYFVKVGSSFSSPKATVKASNGEPLSGVTYTSSNPDVASVGETTGEVTPAAVGTTTITATYAATTGYSSSSASYTLEVYEKSYSTMQELQEAATENSTPVMFTFSDIYVTAVNGSNAYISDGTYGALIYTSGHGLTAGNVINGSAVVNLVLYNGQTEIKNFPKEGLQITETTLTPTEADFEIAKENQSALVTIPNAKFSGGMLEYDYGTIKYYDNFKTGVAFEEGESYNVTGIVVVFNDDIEICPRKAADVEIISSEEGVDNFTWDSTKQNYEAQQTDEVKSVELDVVTSDSDPVTIKFGQGTANENAKPQYYFLSGKNVAAVRFYKGNTLTISAPKGQAVSDIIINYVSGYAKTFTPNTGSYSVNGLEGTWSGISSTVTLTNTDMAARFTSIKVTYVPLTETGKTVTLPSTGMATFTPDAVCIIGDGTVSKYITGLEENGYTLVEEDAPVVAEGEGVLLTGKPGDEYKLYTHTSLSADKNERNKLVGAIKTTFAPIDSYVLQDKGNGPRFYHVGKANNFDINGHAYLSEKILEGEEASGVKVLYFAGDDATAIEEVNEIAETEGAIYNLQGVQVNSSYKGIVIRGGKKFLNK